MLRFSVANNFSKPFSFKPDPCKIIKSSKKYFKGLKSLHK